MKQLFWYSNIRHTRSTWINLVQTSFYEQILYIVRETCWMHNTSPKMLCFYIFISVTNWRGLTYIGKKFWFGTKEINKCIFLWNKLIISLFKQKPFLKISITEIIITRTMAKVSRYCRSTLYMFKKKSERHQPPLLIFFLSSGSILKWFISSLLLIVNASQPLLTLPMTGISTEPQVSAPQWTMPEAKSAVIIPATGNKKEC